VGFPILGYTVQKGGIFGILRRPFGKNFSPAQRAWDNKKAGVISSTRAQTCKGVFMSKQLPRMGKFYKGFEDLKGLTPRLS